MCKVRGIHVVFAFIGGSDYYNNSPPGMVFILVAACSQNFSCVGGGELLFTYRRCSVQSRLTNHKELVSARSSESARFSLVLASCVFLKGECGGGVLIMCTAVVV